MLLIVAAYILIGMAWSILFFKYVILSNHENGEDTDIKSDLWGIRFVGVIFWPLFLITIPFVLYFSYIKYIINEVCLENNPTRGL